MHPYLGLGDHDRKEMLAAVGCTNSFDLFSHIEKSVSAFDMADGGSEWEMVQNARKRAAQNKHLSQCLGFLGAGVYDHWYPAVIDHLVSRGEFLTAYTPYQPELSQGTLQLIYEFQSLMCRLYRMDVANASVYDGANALVECVSMALRAKQGGTQPQTVVVTEAIHPEYREVLFSHFSANDSVRFVTASVSRESGNTRWESCGKEKDSDIVAVVGQFPNFFGIVDPISDLVAYASQMNALSIVVNNEPYAFGVWEPPGDLGADLVAAEVQGLGCPMGYGGPHIGVVLCKRAWVRQLPGRLVGKTTAGGTQETAYTLTLSTREQHIRRERATSNICTNQALMASRVVAHCSLLGKAGFVSVANQNALGSRYAVDRWSRYMPVLFPKGVFFNEIAFELPPEVKIKLQSLAQDSVFVGVDRDRVGNPPFPTLGDQDFVLVCVTEKHRPEDIDCVTERLGG